MTTPESNEMATLPSPAPPAATAEPSTSTNAPPPPVAAPTSTAATTSTQTQTQPPPAADNPPTSTSTSIPDPVDPITPLPQTSSSPSSSAAAAATDSDSPTPADGPAVLITLLLTTGARHPYKIDAKYLRKRNVTVEDNDPYNLPVQTLKELILRDWRDDWEAKPNSPSAIRLISMGLELQEGEQLRDKRFNATGPNIVHMVIKRELPEDEEIKDGKKNRAEVEGGRRSPNCCGCVIL